MSSTKTTKQETEVVYIPTDGLQRFVCHSCHRLLFRAILFTGSIVEDKCWHKSCKEITRFKAV